MTGTQSLETVSTKLQRIAELARNAPGMTFTTLAHHVDKAFLGEAFRRTRKDGAAGVDGVTAEQYAANLDANLESLLNRFKSGTYRAPPVKRVFIPKGDGSLRPIGIPTLEDKVLQRAVVMVLQAVYEQDFLPCSFGSRPGRSAHQALDELRRHLMTMRGGWLIDLDVSKYFDTVVHEHLRKILDQRVKDGVIRRAIGKWLSAGVLEEGRLSYPEAGTPQGGVVSPLLANIYLHEVLDKWFSEEVKPRLSGRAELVRYVDDAVLVFENEADARRVMEVLPKRFQRFGLKVHPEKTKLVCFKHPWKSPPGGPGTFTFLGFLHHWGETSKGGWSVKVKTAKDRLKRSLKKVSAWCQKHRHLSVGAQAAALGRMITGHCQYYGRTGNSVMLKHFANQVKRIWRKWLGRRRQRRDLTRERFSEILNRHPLPTPLCVHSVLRPTANP